MLVISIDGNTLGYVMLIAIIVSIEDLLFALPDRDSSSDKVLAEDADECYS